MNQSILDLVHAEDRSIFMRHMQIKPSQTPGNPPDEGQSPSVPEYINLGMSPTVFRGLSSFISSRLTSILLHVCALSYIDFITSKSFS